MFNSLDEMMRDDQKTAPPGERWFRYVAVLLVSAVLFGGLYAGIRYIE